MGSLSDLEAGGRLLLAAVLGAVLGMEREYRQKDAGLRTNILITLGSSLFTMMSIELTAGQGDPSRVAAQIVTGIGFLGGGAILRTKAGVQGLTTAAMIWVNAAIGVAAGGGQYHLAVIATAVTLGATLLLAPVEKYLQRPFGTAEVEPKQEENAEEEDDEEEDDRK